MSVSHKSGAAFLELRTVVNVGATYRARWRRESCGCARLARGDSGYRGHNTVSSTRQDIRVVEVMCREGAVGESGKRWKNGDPCSRPLNPRRRILAIQRADKSPVVRNSRGDLILGADLCGAWLRAISVVLVEPMTCFSKKGSCR